ncbi:DNA replication complex GINS protein SLD5 [Trichoderma asperellum]|uniref:DNA replication complex GINS protein SLD5 n=1 Tax=Trichoderma asperellum TaxID=101201 RepID=A0A6V8QPZ7_TRIAP|nr:DNA replication complex GINS protein SLD5 [Trichoderma asperellum]
MDIDDILREVDPASHGIPLETRDLQALTRLWVAERSAPELLNWPADGLFERVNSKIKSQIEKIEDMTGDMDPKTNFALIVIQTELERYKFLALLHNHYLSSFLSSFPQRLQNLNDTAGNVSMIDSPDLDTAVFIRLLRDKDVFGRGTDVDTILPAASGDILILRWSSAKDLVENGEAELV